MGKQSKMKHHHVPVIERTLPMERIIAAFQARFDDPYLDPMAELSFEELTVAFPDMPKEELEEGLSHWTNHSGEKSLSTKIVETGGGEKRVWFVHGLVRRQVDPSLYRPGRVALG